MSVGWHSDDEKIFQAAMRAQLAYRIIVDVAPALLESGSRHFQLPDKGTHVPHSGDFPSCLSAYQLSLAQGKFRDIAIISLSLGVTRKFELRPHCHYALACLATLAILPLFATPARDPGTRIADSDTNASDLMTMEGMTQKHFQHRVPKEDNITGPRINLTWRWVGKHTPQCPACRARGSVNGPPPELTPVPSGRTPPPPAQPIESPVTSFKQDPQQTPILPSLGLEAPAVSSTAPEPGGLRAASCKAAPQMPPCQYGSRRQKHRAAGEIVSWVLLLFVCCCLLLCCLRCLLVCLLVLFVFAVFCCCYASWHGAAQMNKTCPDVCKDGVCTLRVKLQTLLSSLCFALWPRCGFLCTSTAD
ncbi:unnamed protein product [Polarella glacialis]|uniref:Fe2OG dioxygenase domain-containing protein n=1 Tax=Polarella glacialis TaxID=89957 RepID=A0A813LNT7_POLGL|nr:unnamed protein product [Polarella glacialis]